MDEAKERKLRQEIDAVRTEVRNLRGAIDGQNKSIQQIADKVGELRGQLATALNSMRSS